MNNQSAYQKQGSPASSEIGDDLPQTSKRTKLLQRFGPVISGAVLALVIIVIVVSVVVTKGGDDNSHSTSDVTSGESTGKPSDGCEAVPPNDRLVVFWQSEVEGCEKIPKGVTHVAWAFALVADGEIVPAFQGSDAYIKSCVQTLRKKCIKSLGSVGGGTNNQNMTQVSDMAAFGKSAAELVTKFDLDGIDMDDETVGGDFNETRALGMIKATRSALDELDGGSELLVTYDSYFYEGDTSYCEPNRGTSRCFSTDMLPYLDWVNIMAYNVNLDNATAEGIYQDALNTTFAAWFDLLGGNYSLVTLGVCIDGGCAYGPGPSRDVIDSWAEFAAQPKHGGMMVWAASKEVSKDFPDIRNIIDVMHQ